MGEDGRVVFGGVDTHRDVHVAAVVDSLGRVLGSASFQADAAGHEQLGDWLRSLGRVIRVGVEGTGSYGAGLARYLTASGCRGGGGEPAEPAATPPEGRQDRQRRRRRGSSGSCLGPG